MPKSAKRKLAFAPDPDDRTIVDAYLRAHGSSYDAWVHEWEQKQETAFRDLLLHVLRENKEGVLILLEENAAKQE